MRCCLFHHLSFGVTKMAPSMRFYDAALGALGYRRVFTDCCAGDPDQAVGYGLVDDEDLLCLKLRPDSQPPGPGFHLAFAAPDRAAVDAFYQAALAHGGSDNGAPGLRPDYGAHYYAAFVLDPDGYRLEAVCKAPGL